MRTLPCTKRNWVAIAVRIVGGIHEAARICHVRPVTLKRWYWRGCVERVEPARMLAAASGLSVLRVIGFEDMPSLGKRRARVQPIIRPTAQRRGPHAVLTFAVKRIDGQRGRIAQRGPGRFYVGRATTR